MRAASAAVAAVEAGRSPHTPCTVRPPAAAPESHEVGRLPDLPAGSPVTVELRPTGRLSAEVGGPGRLQLTDWMAAGLADYGRLSDWPTSHLADNAADFNRGWAAEAPA